MRKFSLPLSFTLASAALAGGTPPAGAQDGPVRLARVAYVVGEVSWRPDDHTRWARLVRNLPMRQGAEVACTGAGRAELQFDDGSRLYMGQGAVITLKTLYSDTGGEYSELALRDGTACLRCRHDKSVYQMDTPYCSVDATGPTHVRVDAVRTVDVELHHGHCTVDDRRGRLEMRDPGVVTLGSDNDPLVERPLRPADPFETWCNNLNANEERFYSGPHRSYVPSNIALVSDDYDRYGDWHDRPQYGHVWYPHRRHRGWRPYYDGHWGWVDPYGWTWVSDEDWGWAPYHYGTWIDDEYGWGWVPGPRHQYWSPAAVDYCYVGNRVAWVPLSPREVRYPPTLSIGFSGGDWSLFFSIGGSAVYYPSAAGYSVPYAWPNYWVNDVPYRSSTTVVNYNTYFVDPSYVPVNARYAPGATLATVAAFGGAGAFQPLPANSPIFRQARYVGAPSAQFGPVAGPQAVRPSAIAYSPTRAVLARDPAPTAALTRNVFSAPNPVRDRMAGLANSRMRQPGAGSNSAPPAIRAAGPATAPTGGGRAGAFRAGAAGTQPSGGFPSAAPRATSPFGGAGSTYRTAGSAQQAAHRARAALAGQGAGGHGNPGRATFGGAAAGGHGAMAQAGHGGAHSPQQAAANRARAAMGIAGGAGRPGMAHRGGGQAVAGAGGGHRQAAGGAVHGGGHALAAHGGSGSHGAAARHASAGGGHGGGHTMTAAHGGGRHAGASAGHHVGGGRSAPAMHAHGGGGGGGHAMHAAPSFHGGGGGRHAMSSAPSFHGGGGGGPHGGGQPHFGGPPGGGHGHGGGGGGPSRSPGPPPSHGGGGGGGPHGGGGGGPHGGGGGGPHGGGGGGGPHGGGGPPAGHGGGGGGGGGHEKHGKG